MISNYESERPIKDSFGRVFKVLVQENIEGRWVFKSGQPLPEIAPRKYVLKSIQCYTDDLLNISILFKGLGSSVNNFKTFSLHTTEGVKYSNNSRTFAEFDCVLNFLKWENIIPEVILINQKDDFNFVIHYETNL